MKFCTNENRCVSRHTFKLELSQEEPWKVHNMCHSAHRRKSKDHVEPFVSIAIMMLKAKHRHASSANFALCFKQCVFDNMVLSYAISKESIRLPLRYRVAFQHCRWSSEWIPLWYGHSPKGSKVHKKCGWMIFCMAVSISLSLLSWGSSCSHSARR
jgi:hypothetical protein